MSETKSLEMAKIFFKRHENKPLTDEESKKYKDWKKSVRYQGHNSTYREDVMVRRETRGRTIKHNRGICKFPKLSISPKSLERTKVYDNRMEVVAFVLSQQCTYEEFLEKLELRAQARNSQKQ